MKEYIPKPGERVEVASRFVKDCENLLDVGCGDGIINHFISDRVKNIYGVDNSREMVKKSIKRGLRVKLVDLDNDDFPFKTNYFDVITCLDVIEHVKNPNALLEKIHRILKKNGTLIIATPNIRFSNHLYELLLKGRFPKTSTDISQYDGGHIHFFTFNDLIDLVKKNGFLIEEIEGVINKTRRGWKGRILEFIFGKKIMLEFRAPGILISCIKK